MKDKEAWLRLMGSQRGGLDMVAGTVAGGNSGSQFRHLEKVCYCQLRITHHKTCTDICKRFVLGKCSKAYLSPHFLLFSLTWPWVGGERAGEHFTAPRSTADVCGHVRAESPGREVTEPQASRPPCPWGSMRGGLCSWREILVLMVSLCLLLWALVGFVLLDACSS